MEDPLLGKVISERYRVIRKLGEGGMGAVYLAEHVFIEKKVALKVLAPELARREDLSARFLQEAKSASRIGHENVIDISDFGQSPEGFVYIAMEYLDGVDLGAAIRQDGPLPWSRAKGIIVQIFKALRAAHQQGIVHRDMKPENIFLIQREGRPDFVKLLDFGIAKVMGLADNAPRLTRTGMIFGTPEYMAPEQAEGKDADHRVDVYAAGCVMYHVLTGQTPFQADSFMAMLTKHILEEPVAPSARRPDLGIAPELDAIVMKALEKERDKRWQTMTEMMDAAIAVGEGIPVGTSAYVASAAPGPAGLTRPLGGGDSSAIQIVTNTARASETQLFARDSVDSVIASDDGRGRVAPGGNGRLLLVGVGLAVGVVGALVYFLGGSSAPSVTPAAVVQPAPALPAPAAPAPETPPAAAAVQDEKPAEPAPRPVARPSTAERGKKTYRRIVAPTDDGPPPPPPVPGSRGATDIPGLKNPFQR